MGEAAMGYAVKGEGVIRYNIRAIFSLRTRSRRGLIMGPLTHRDHLPDLRDVAFFSWGRESFLDQTPLES